MALAFVVVTVLYCGLGAATIAVTSGPHSRVPLADLISVGFGRAGRDATAVLAVALTMGTMNVYIGGASKLIASLAHEGALPRWLAGDAHRSVPRRPLVLLAVPGVVLLGALRRRFREHRRSHPRDVGVLHRRLRARAPLGRADPRRVAARDGRGHVRADPRARGVLGLVPRACRSQREPRRSSFGARSASPLTSYDRLVRRRLAALAIVGVVLCLGLSTSTRSARAEPAATSLPWAIVFQHVDLTLGDVTGLDILRSGDQRAHALTRRRPGADDRDNGAVWSPDGRRVAFARFYSDWGLYVVDGLGGVARRLATGSDEALAWSPDGTRVAFSRHCSSSRRTATCKPGVYVAFIGGRPIARVFPSEGTPSWSPDGRRIVCRCANRIYLFSADGSNRRRLDTQTDGQLGAGSWCPTAR